MLTYAQKRTLITWLLPAGIEGSVMAGETIDVSLGRGNIPPRLVPQHLFPE
jgi:hypothetical protein